MPIDRNEASGTNLFDIHSGRIRSGCSVTTKFSSTTYLLCQNDSLQSFLQYLNGYSSRFPFSYDVVPVLQTK